MAALRASAPRDRFHHIHTTATERPDGLMDSYVPAAQLGPGALVIESHHEAGLRVGRGSIVHGLAGLNAPIEVPEEVVLHQVPVLLPDRRNAFTVRAYGVEDDPKVAIASGRALWFGTISWSRCGRCRSRVIRSR